MTTLVFDLARSVFGVALLVLAVVKLIAIFRAFIFPAWEWINEHREDGLRQTLIFFGIVEDDE